MCFIPASVSCQVKLVSCLQQQGEGHALIVDFNHFTFRMRPRPWSATSTLPTFLTNHPIYWGLHHKEYPFFQRHHLLFPRSHSPGNPGKTPRAAAVTPLVQARWGSCCHFQEKLKNLHNLHPTCLVLRTCCPQTAWSHSPGHHHNLPSSQTKPLLPF